MAKIVENLGPHEMEWGRLNGIKLFEHSKGRENGRRPGTDPETIKRDDILGMRAEIAVAKYLKLYYTFRTERFGEPDVCQIQVKSTTCHDGKLYVETYKPTEHGPDHPYLLVTGSNDYENFVLVGWIMRSQARKQFKESVKCHRVPQESLKPIASLPYEYMVQDNGAFRTYEPPRVDSDGLHYPRPPSGSRNAKSRISKYLHFFKTTQC